MIPSVHPKLILLVGPPGSGKSTRAKSLIYDDGDHGAATVCVNQDSQGKAGHQEIFREAIRNHKDILVDRMNFNKEQRRNYLAEAEKHGYDTKIIVLHENYDTCLDRMLNRKDHETINDEKSARSALQTFFTRYERPEPGEAGEIVFEYPECFKPKAIWSDLDGTLADCSHRTHFVRPSEEQGAGNIGTFDPTTMTFTVKPFKKDWNSFFKGIENDTVVKPVMEVLRRFSHDYHIVYCSGRPDDYRKVTQEWLTKHEAPEGPLFMRMRHDSRKDSITKEVLLDFEVLTRFSVLFCLDDRTQVVNMLRKRGLTVFQVAEGDF